MLENIYDKLNILTDLKKALTPGAKVRLSGCVPSQTEHLLAGINKFSYKLLIASDEKTALEIMENYIAFDREIIYYPPVDPMFFKADIRGNYITEQRLEAIRRICEGRGSEGSGQDPALTVITVPEAFDTELASFDEIRKETIILKKGDSIVTTELADHLTALGYENSSLTTAHGEFSIRGNIIDIFPFGAANPYRLDLWGDEIDTIRTFDADSQRSVSETDELMIFPGADIKAGEGSAGLLDYFDPAFTLVVIYEPERTYETRQPLDVDAFPVLAVSLFLKKSDVFAADTFLQINAKNIPSYNGRFSELVKDLEKYKSKGWDVTLCCGSQARTERLRSDLADYDIYTRVIVASVRTGFEYPDIKCALISEVDIFGAKRAKRKAKKRFAGDPIKAFTDLGIGDYVVHEQHGIGIYQGIKRIKTDDVERDYMMIEYAEGAHLYVLATQFDRVQKYSGSEGAHPKVHRLGGKEWTNTKARARASVQDIAGELVRLYAARQVKSGYQYSPDTVWQREFEEEFEFDETEDQLKAVREIKEDMESTRIMDRLICGDVGFGKTEVAIRAAFKAVQDGKQVAFLAPTTILVRQHYDNICSRMANYPVEVRMLSRFASPKEQKQTIAGMKEGRVDIVVGTHRLLSKDVGFKDLGLLIIDEEQRFGVAHKEKIKNLRRDVDVLALSATPIPRTLHMSLVGIRDMSLLTEPPVDRVPIQTYVMEYSEEAVKEAILREIARGGQIYYVYNRIDDIERVAAEIQEMVPSASVSFAHGRMSARELEQIMTDYIDRETDVLVSTTIIESGLDIPNVNTIIIHDADKYGLSQLYQLRGRVGRSNRTAYAFLMYRRDKLLREVAEKRLKAIKDFSDLGSGLRIAMRDLEIRGAGNVLGAEQSGHMDAVGYELYCKLLNQAVALLKGENPEPEHETDLHLRVDGFIPSEYINDTNEKLNMYKKISLIANADNADAIREELEDRFGPLPTPVENLVSVALLKAMAHDMYITDITGEKGIFKISMYEHAEIDTYLIHGFLNKYKGQLKFVAEKRPYFTYIPVPVPRSFEQEYEVLFNFITSLSEIVEK